MGNKFQQHFCNCFSESKQPISHGSSNSLTSPPTVANNISKPPNRKSCKVNQKGNEVATMMSKLQNGQRNISLNDFLVERAIGRGAFGKVLLVKKDPLNLNSQYFAMKIIRKKDIFKQKLTENIQLEKYILSKQKHPFIVDLKYAFQTSNKIYLIMEYIPGGELFKLLRKVKRFNEESAKFYLSEVLLAIEFLHKKMKVIYRDLKPENILLTEKGHVKITDFGLSKKTEEKTYTMVGTIEYLAPEVLTKAGHTNAVDYWGMGILLYEMLAGYPPFTAPNRNFEEIEKLIMENKPFFPDYFPKEAVDLIKKLMNSDTEKRLGVQEINDIKNHKFFKGVDWSNVLNLKVTPPYTIKNNVVHSLDAVDNSNLKEIKETLCSSKNLPSLAGITYNYDQLNSSVFTNNESPMRQSDFQK